MTSLNSIKNPLNVAAIKKANTFKKPAPIKPKVAVSPTDIKEEVKVAVPKVVKDEQTGNCYQTLSEHEAD